MSCNNAGLIYQGSFPITVLKSALSLLMCSSYKWWYFVTLVERTNESMNESYSLISTGYLDAGQRIFNNRLNKEASLSCEQRGGTAFLDIALSHGKIESVWSLKNSITFVTAPGEKHNISVDYLNTCKLAFWEHMADVSNQGARCIQAAPATLMTVNISFEQHSVRIPHVS